MHARAVARWLMGAQDATPDDGVAAEYLVGYRRWRSSFPETTGYIIETLLDFSELDDWPELADVEITCPVKGTPAPRTGRTTARLAAKLANRPNTDVQDALPLVCFTRSPPRIPDRTTWLAYLQPTFPICRN